MTGAEILSLVIEAAKLTRGHLGGGAELKVARELIERALEAAVDELDVTSDQKQVMFDGVLDLLAAGGDLSWLLTAVPQQAPVDLPAIAGQQHLLERFQRFFNDGLVAEASKPSSPLSNYFLVTTSSFIRDEVVAIRSDIAELQRRGVPPALIDMSDLPSPVAERLRTLEPELAQLAADCLRDGSVDVKRRAAKLLAEAPSWLTSGPWDLYAALGDHASAYGDYTTAANAFEQAANSGGPNALWLTNAAAAAHEDPLRRSSLLAQARAAGPTPEEARFCDVQEAAFVGDVVKLSEICLVALRDGVANDIATAAIGAQALGAQGRFTEAIEILRPRCSDRGRTGLAILLGTMLVSRAESEGARRRLADAVEAQQIAVEARDIRRTWLGDSAAAVAIACQAAAIQSNWSDLIHLGTTEGSATIVEANHPEVRRLVSFARMCLGRTTDADDLTSRLTAEGVGHLNAGRFNEAQEVLMRAAQEASDLSSLATALGALASTGADTLPRINEITAADPDQAEIIKLAARLNRGDAAAAAALRALSRRHRLAARPLVAYLAANSPTEAAAIAEEAGARHEDAALFIDAADLYAAAGDVEGANRAIRRAFDQAPIGSRARHNIRRTAIQIAWNAEDLPGIVNATRSAIAEGDREPEVRWTLIEALTRLRRLHDAWAELHSDPELPPDTSERARRILQLQARVAPDRLDIAADICDRYPDDHDLHALACIQLVGMAPGLPAAPDALARMQAHLARFTERYPGDRLLRSETIPADPTELLNYVREKLEATAAADREMRTLHTLALLGRVPVGLVAELCGRPYVEALLAVDAISFMCCPADQDELRQQIADAEHAIGSGVVLDPSALVVASYIRDHWLDLAAAFGDMALTPQGHAAVDELAYHPIGTLHLSLDPATDQVRRDVTEEEERERIQERRDWVRARANELGWTGNHPIPSDLVPLSDEDELRLVLWPEALGAAVATGQALWVDDVATVALAKSLGTPAFGTVALLFALERRGWITEVAHAAAGRSLYLAQARDLPLDAKQLLLLAGITGWNPAASTSPLARPHLWATSTLDAFGVAVGVARGLMEAGHSKAIGDVVYMSAQGLLRLVPPGAAAPMIATIVGGLIAQLDLGEEAVLTAVSAARYACAEHEEMGDPLVPIVDTLVGIFREMFSRDIVSRKVASQFAGLGDEDRATVTRRLLELDVSGASAREVLRRDVNLRPRGE